VLGSDESLKLSTLEKLIVPVGWSFAVSRQYGIMKSGAGAL